MDDQRCSHSNLSIQTLLPFGYTEAFQESIEFPLPLRYLFFWCAWRYVGTFLVSLYSCIRYIHMMRFYNNHTHIYIIHTCLLNTMSQNLIIQSTANGQPTLREKKALEIQAIVIPIASPVCVPSKYHWVSILYMSLEMGDSHSCHLEKLA